MLRSFSLLACCLLFSPLAALAQVSLYDLGDAFSYGTAGMSSAGAFGIQALPANPASLSFEQCFGMEFSSALDFAKNSYKFVNLGIVNSETYPVAIGSSYRLLSVGPSKERSTAHILTLSASVLMGPIFHIGVSARQYFLLGPQNAYPFNFDLGILSHWFWIASFSLSAHNLIQHSSIHTPRYFAFSSAFRWSGLRTFDFITVIAEIHHSLDNDQLLFRLGGSLEYLFSKTLSMRLGYAYEWLPLPYDRQIQKGHVLGMGLGYTAAFGSVDLGYRHTFGGSHNRVLALTGRFWFEPPKIRSLFFG